MYNAAILGFMSILAEATAMTGLTEFITSVTGALGNMSLTNLAPILVAALAITVPLLIGWFAYRWVTRKAASALRKGRI